MTKPLIALVLDRSTEASGKFTDGLSKHFGKLYLQHDLALMERDLRGLRPQILFLNLGIEQRESTFAFIEKHLPLLEERPVVLGYLDYATPEFLAHAVENGVQDVFTRPFDPALIAAKVGKYTTVEGPGPSSINYAKLRKSLKADVVMNLLVTAVDEHGITFQGPHYISKGTKFWIRTALVQEIFGIPALQVLVSQTSELPDSGDWLIYVEPADQNETTIASLRRFILGKT